MIIYHNPRCSKSRQALQLLKDNGEEPDVIEYLKNPLNQTELADLIKKLKISAHELLRNKEDEYSELEADELLYLYQKLASDPAINIEQAEQPMTLEHHQHQFILHPYHGAIISNEQP